MDLNTLDSPIITKCHEPLSHFTQRWLGIDCFILSGICAALCMSISTTGLYLAIRVPYAPMSYRISDAAYLGVILAFIIYFVTLHGRGFLQKRRTVYHDLQCGSKNRWLPKGRFSFVFLLVNTFSWIMSLVHHTSNISTLSISISVMLVWNVEAFACCTPEHPGPSELKKLLLRIKNGLKRLSDSVRPIPNPA